MTVQDVTAQGVILTEVAAAKVSSLLAQEDQQLKRFDDRAKNQLKLLDQRIQSLKSRLAAFPSPDHYEIDCFALDERRDFDHMPLYEHGVAYP